ncbi:hypothetical protein DFH06DRAFT_1477249 [Mycena polygramma]|nr:hypothetical protein DFH06DRAFT_1477249 [Mycena polygramma]
MNTVSCPAAASKSSALPGHPDCVLRSSPRKKHESCFGCSDHWPVLRLCSMALLWLKECRDDSKTANARITYPLLQPMHEQRAELVLDLFTKTKERWRR